MEIVIPDLEDDEDDLPLPSIAHHGFGGGGGGGGSSGFGFNSPGRVASPIGFGGGGGGGSGSGFGGPGGGGFGSGQGAAAGFGSSSGAAGGFGSSSGAAGGFGAHGFGGPSHSNSNSRSRADSDASLELVSGSQSLYGGQSSQSLYGQVQVQAQAQQSSSSSNPNPLNQSQSSYSSIPQPRPTPAPSQSQQQQGYSPYSNSNGPGASSQTSIPIQSPPRHTGMNLPEKTRSGSMSSQYQYQTYSSSAANSSSTNIYAQGQAYNNMGTGAGAGVGNNSVYANPISKKTSFASLKNAFKSATGNGNLGMAMERSSSAGYQGSGGGGGGGSNGLPSLSGSGTGRSDHTNYPVALMNPFSGAGNGNGFGSGNGNGFGGSLNSKGGLSGRDTSSSKTGTGKLGKGSASMSNGRTGGMKYQQQQQQQQQSSSGNSSFTHVSRPSAVSLNASGTPSTSQGSFSVTRRAPATSTTEDHSHSSNNNNSMYSSIPVPAIPSQHRKAFSHSQSGGHSGTGAGEMKDDEWDSKVPEPKTPSEFALHVLFRRFVALGDAKVKAIMSRSLTQHPSLPHLLGPEVDPVFDQLLVSLAHVAKKHARPVVESIMTWRKMQAEAVSRSEVRNHLNDAVGSTIKVVDAAALLSERKILAATYIVNQTLLEVVKSATKDSLGEALGASLERNIFEAFSRDSSDFIQNPNKAAVAAQAAEILGQLTRLRFVTVTDRFIGPTSELDRLASQPSLSREMEQRAEHLVHGMKFFQLKLYPEPDLENAADYMERLSHLFDRATDLALKAAVAETLVELLHPLVKTATAETNHPIWSEAIHMIHQRAMSMASKPRYWSVAFPLSVVALCVSSQDIFRASWSSMADAAVQKLKERACRNVALSSILRLLWVYLMRGGESATTTSTRVEALLLTCLPTDTATLLPPDLDLEPFVFMLECILAKQPHLGQDLVLEYLQESIISGSRTSSPRGGVMQPERMSVALLATLLALQHLQNNDEPDWPKSSDFDRFELLDLDNRLGEPLTMATMEKPNLLEFFDRCGPTVGSILILLDRELGHLSVFNESQSANGDVAGDEVSRQHGETTVTFARRWLPRLRLLGDMMLALPRCLHPKVDLEVITSIVSRATCQVEPELASKAEMALERLVQHHDRPRSVILVFTRFLFRSHQVFHPRASCNRGLMQQQERLLAKWTKLLETLLARVIARDAMGEGVSVSADFKVTVEAAALFLFTSVQRTNRVTAHQALKLVSQIEDLNLAQALARRQSRMYISTPKAAQASLLSTLEKEWTNEQLTDMLERIEMSADQRIRLINHLQSRTSSGVLDLSISESPLDQVIWDAVLPRLLRQADSNCSEVVIAMRPMLVNCVLLFQPAVSLASGVTNRPNQGSTISQPVILADQWRSLLSCLFCITAGVSSTKHSASRSDGRISVEQERLNTSRELLLLVTPYLTSESSRFRIAAINALGQTQQPLLLPLMQHLHKLNSHITEDAKLREMAHRPMQLWDAGQSRLYTAIAQVMMLVAPMLRDLEMPRDGPAVALFLDFIQETHMQLAESAAKEDFELQRLRRYFCGSVQHLASALPRWDSSERYLTPQMRGAIYRLCDEWCTLGRRADVAKARESATLLAAAEHYRANKNKAQYLDVLQADTRDLSVASGYAMAALCDGPLIPADVDTSPAQHSNRSQVEPLSVLQWIRGLLSSQDRSCHLLGRKALQGLLRSNTGCKRLVNEVIHQAYSEDAGIAPDRTFFDILVQSCLAGQTSLTFPKQAALALSKLGQSDVAIRLRALQLLEHISAEQDRPALRSCLVNVSSSSMKVYLAAQGQLSALMAMASPEHAPAIIQECTSKIPQLDTSRRQAPLAVLPPWLQRLNLSGPTLSAREDGVAALESIFCLSVRLAEHHPLEIGELWSSLITSDTLDNITPLIVYLVEEVTYRNGNEALQHAQRAMSLFAGTEGAAELFGALCGLVDPVRFVVVDRPLPDAKPRPASTQSTIESLLGKKSRTQSRSAGHVAMLFAGELLSEALVGNVTEGDHSFAVLLQALTSQVDSDVPSTAEASQQLLQKIVTTLMSLQGFDEPTEEGGPKTSSSGVLQKATLQIKETVWKRGDLSQLKPPLFVPQAMAGLVPDIVSILATYRPDIRQEWGEQALLWATECAVPHMACRSFQIFRTLMPQISPAMLVTMLARYSVTVAGSSPVYADFNREVLHTFCAVVYVTPGEDLLAFPQLFWCIAAALSTPVLEEYQLVIELLALFLDKVDLGDSEVMRYLLDNQPSVWIGGRLRLQALLLPGLRSSKTMEAAFDVIRRLAGISFDNLIDSTESRLMHLFVATMPWMLLANEKDLVDNEIGGLAEDIAAMAERCEEHGLSRIMTSFAKRRFRAKEDFVRQAASCVRDFLKQQAAEVVILLLGLVLNNEDWLKANAMQMLTFVFQDPEARKPLATYGSELLMPLLRLLSGPLAEEALKVLDTSVTFAAGDAPGKVLRMSVIGRPEGRTDGGSIFGVPDATGWSVSKAHEAERTARKNVEAVVSTFTPEDRAMSMHGSSAPGTAVLEQTGEDGFGGHLIIDEPDDGEDRELEMDEAGDSLGDLVGALHTLNTFFNEDSEMEDEVEDELPVLQVPQPREQKTNDHTSERRVRAILARSLIRQPSTTSFDWTIDPSLPNNSSQMSLNMGLSSQDPSQEYLPQDEKSPIQSLIPDRGGVGTGNGNSNELSDPAIQLTRQFDDWRNQIRHATQESMSSLGGRSNMTTSTSTSDRSQFELDEDESTPNKGMTRETREQSTTPMRSVTLSGGESKKPPTRFRDLLLGTAASARTPSPTLKR